jgi:hypothetical protein
LSKQSSLQNQIEKIQSENDQILNDNKNLKNQLEKSQNKILSKEKEIDVILQQLKSKEKDFQK